MVSGPHNFSEARREYLIISIDYAYLGMDADEEVKMYEQSKARATRGEEAADDIVPTQYQPVLIVHDDHSECIFALGCDRKGVSPRVAARLVAILEWLGHVG